MNRREMEEKVRQDRLREERLKDERRRMKLCLFGSAGTVVGGKTSVEWATTPYGWCWVRLGWRPSHPIMSVQQRLFADSRYQRGMQPPLRV